MRTICALMSLSLILVLNSCNKVKGGTIYKGLYRGTVTSYVEPSLSTNAYVEFTFEKDNYELMTILPFADTLYTNGTFKIKNDLITFYPTSENTSIYQPINDYVITDGRKGKRLSFRQNLNGEVTDFQIVFDEYKQK